VGTKCEYVAAGFNNVLGDSEEALRVSDMKLAAEGLLDWRKDKSGAVGGERPTAVGPGR